jgi:shikimate kinase
LRESIARVVILVGPPGSGKTSVGKDLSLLLGWQFIDLDERIEEKLGATVQQLFAQSGESGFRQMESEALTSLVQERIDKAVVATGGGIVTRASNFDLMKRIGAIVCLQAEVSTLAARLRDDLTRPLLKPDGDSQSLSEKLSRLVADRRQFYELPEITVTTDALTPREVATIIANQLGLGQDLPKGGP